MFRELCSLIDQGLTVIGPSGAAVSSVTSRWLETTGRSAAPQPQLQTLGHWLRGQHPAVGREYLLLSESQAALIWETAAANAITEDVLLNPRVAGRLARRAWALAKEHDMHTALAQAGTAETAWLSALARGVEHRLDHERWLDPALLVSRLSEAPALAPAAWFGFDHFSPGLRRLAGEPRRLESSKEAFPERLNQARADDPKAELQQALDWAAAGIQTDPVGHRAIVIPDLASRWNEVERIGLRYAELAADIRTQRPLAADEPLRVGRALLAISLGDSDLSRLLSILQSPLCLGGEATIATRVALERKLRDQSQQDLPAAHWPEALTGAFGRWHRLLQQDLPTSAAPSFWASEFHRILDTTEWVRGSVGERCRAAVRTMARALDDLAGASLVQGTLSASEALGRLDALIERSSTSRVGKQLQLASTLNELGPGLAGVWVTGANAGSFPPKPRPIALLPMTLQREYGLPTGQTTDGIQQLGRLSRYADSVILSWVERRHDAPMAKSPLLTSLATWSERPLRNVTAAEQVLDRSFESIPPLIGEPRSRSARILTLQAKCPARAFFEGRLGLRPLERLRRGVAPKERGILAHSVLEHVYRAMQERDVDLPVAVADAEPIVLAAIDALWPRPKSASRRAALAVEAIVLRQRVRSLIEAESSRPPFVLHQTEAKIDFRVGDLDLKLRVDRIDEHGDGRRSVIDYKTGSVQRKEFLSEPVVEMQLPVYALGLRSQGHELAGALLLQLSQEGTRYEGAWDSGLFPDTSRGDLPQLVEQWSRAAESLAADFKAGTGWLNDEYRVLAGADWAPLVRPMVE